MHPPASRHDTFSGADLACALAVVVIWGLNFAAMKLALRDFTPFQLGAFRYCFAVVPLLFFIKPPATRWYWVLLYGACQGVGQFGLLFFAIRLGMTAALASVLMQTQVFFTAILGYLLLRERPTPALRWGLALAGLALLCFALNYLPLGSVRGTALTTLLAGFVLTLAAALMWAVSNIVARHAQQSGRPAFDAVAFVVWSSLVPIIPFSLLSLAADDAADHLRWLSASWSSWVAVAYLGWLATIVAYALWTSLLKRHAANRVAPFSLGVPIIGIAVGVAGLGETISLWQWWGIVLVALALCCVLWGPRLAAGRQEHRRPPTAQPGKGT